MNKFEKILKRSDGLYLCLENNKLYKTFRSIENVLLTKYKMTMINYCIKWDLVNKEDYVQCLICDNYTDSIGKHLSHYHKDIKINDYKKLYGDNIQLIGTMYKKYLSEKMIGNKNVNHTDNTTELKRKQTSPFCIEFWIKKYQNTNIDDLTIIYEQFKINAIKDREYNTRIEYYINKGYSEKDARKLLIERQTTFSKIKCIEKYGEEAGLVFFNKRQDKWLNSLLTNNKFNIGYSQISQDLFDLLKIEFKNNDLLYGSYNNELRLKDNKNSTYLYDFADNTTKSIIEFNGDLFHGNPLYFKENDTPNPFRKNILAKDMWIKDEYKKNIAINNGYKILTIWESEFKKQKQKSIQKCIDFINS